MGSWYTLTQLASPGFNTVSGVERLRIFRNLREIFFSLIVSENTQKLKALGAGGWGYIFLGAYPHPLVLPFVTRAHGSLGSVRLK